MAMYIKLSERAERRRGKEVEKAVLSVAEYIIVLHAQRHESLQCVREDSSALVAQEENRELSVLIFCKRRLALIVSQTR